jgi:hypothetical protein
MLDLVGTENRAILLIFDSIEIYIQRNDVPFEGLIFTNVDVIAHHGAVFTGTAQAEFYRRIGADAGEIHSTVTCAGDSVEAGIERLIEYDTNVSLSAGASNAHEQEGKNAWDGNRAENPFSERSSGDEPTNDEGDPMHSNIPLDYLFTLRSYSF